MKKFLSLILVLSVFTLRSQAPAQDDKEISVKMKISQWNVVIKALRELPYKEAGEPIQEILSQASQQLNPPAKAESKPKPDSTKKKP